MTQNAQDNMTVIGADAKFNGDLTFDSAARVLGTIEGSITSKNTLHIANGANCKATIQAKHVEIEGVVKGNVTASDHVDLKNNGSLTGDIIAARMSMADGASVDGYIRVGKSAAKDAANKDGANTTAEVKPQQQQQTAQAKK